MKKFLFILLALPLSAQEATPPVDPWSSSVGAGLAITSGNSDTTNINVSANTAWDPKTDRLFKAEALYLLGETNGEKQVDKSTALARYEQLFSERAFWFGEVQYLRDPFKAINYLVSPLAGAGYHVIRTDTRKLTFDGAVGGVIEDNDLLGRDTSGALKAGESFEWSISPVSKLTQKLTGLWKADDFGDALYHFDAGLATTVASRLELKLSYVYDYKNETPSPDIEKGDSALFAALLVKF
jgi:putative salt-induced outer membrane protein YdiY